MKLTDERNERRCVCEVSDDRAALCHSARDDSRRSGRKSPLKQPRRVAVAGSIHEICCGQAVIDSANKATRRIAHRNAKANKPPKDRSDGGVKNILEKDVVGVFRGNRADFEHGEARLHEENE